MKVHNLEDLIQKLDPEFIGLTEASEVTLNPLNPS